MAAAPSLADLERDPRLFLYTSLVAGSSHIITATSRLETILRANKIPYQAIDIATDESAKRLWQRRSGGRKLPGLVKEGLVIGDLNEVEEWNEFDELHDNIGPVPALNAAPPSGGQLGVNLAPPSVGPNPVSGPTDHTKPALPPVIAKPPPAKPRGQDSEAEVRPSFDANKGIALPGAEEIAARHRALAARSSVEAASAKAASASVGRDENGADMEPAKTETEKAESEAHGVIKTQQREDEPAAAESDDESKVPEVKDQASASALNDEPKVKDEPKVLETKDELKVPEVKSESKIEQNPDNNDDNEDDTNGAGEADGGAKDAKKEEVATTSAKLDSLSINKQRTPPGRGSSGTRALQLSSTPEPSGSPEPSKASEVRNASAASTPVSVRTIEQHAATPNSASSRTENSEANQRVVKKKTSKWKVSRQPDHDSEDLSEASDEESQ